MDTIATIPMQTIGPVKIIGDELNDEVRVPLATFETPLWPSTNRGARVAMVSGGIKATLVKDQMTRSVVMQAPDASIAAKVTEELPIRFEEMQQIVADTSRFAKLEDIHSKIVGNLLYVRFSLFTGDASGHNMVTKAAESLMNWVLDQYRQLKYVSISGNFCTDKKVSAANSILGRGKYVIAELTIPRKLCQRYLKASPEQIVDLNLKKNLLGSVIAGSLCSANAHFANMLLGIYLATGQDAANIVEASQGIVHAEVVGHDLYFSVTMPNLILGTVGNGKAYDFVTTNLKLLGCDQQRNPGMNARRLALIAASTVLCGELSLLAAQCNPGELMQSHIKLERKGELCD